MWTTGIILAGYWLGNRIPGIDAYLLPIIFVIIAVSLIPVALEINGMRRTARANAPSALPVESTAPAPEVDR